MLLYVAFLVNTYLLLCSANDGVKLKPKTLSKNDQISDELGLTKRLQKRQLGLITSLASGKNMQAKLKELCATDENCVVANSVCVNGKCACIDAIEPFEGRFQKLCCINRTGPDHSYWTVPCCSEWDCWAKDSNLQCVDGKCVCEPGKFKEVLEERYIGHYCQRIGGKKHGVYSSAAVAGSIFAVLLLAIASLACGYFILKRLREENPSRKLLRKGGDSVLGSLVIQPLLTNEKTKPVVTSLEKEESNLEKEEPNLDESQLKDEIVVTGRVVVDGADASGQGEELSEEQKKMIGEETLPVRGHASQKEPMA